MQKQILTLTFYVTSLAGKLAIMIFTDCKHMFNVQSAPLNQYSVLSPPRWTKWTLEEIKRLAILPVVPCVCVSLCSVYISDFQPRFRGTQGFREHLPRVPRLVRKKNKNSPNLAWEIRSYVRTSNRSTTHRRIIVPN